MTRYRQLAAAAALALATAIPAGAPAADAPPVPGHVVLAKPGPEAVIIWDATPVVVTIVNDKMRDDEANALLEHDALRNVAKFAKAISADAKSVTLRVTYQKIGAVNPAYGAQTFAGVERYAQLTLPAADVRNNRDKWMELGERTAVPAWVQFTIVGALPPRS